MKWYQLDHLTVKKQLQVDDNIGLGSEVVKKRQKEFGLNKLQDTQHTSRLILFLQQFQDFMVLVLLAATLVAGLLGEYIDAIAIMVIVLVNGLIGYFQEQKAENSLEKLKELAAPTANVLRNGEWIQISSAEVVVGDVINIQTGNRIVADIRLLTSQGLETEESALTGESIPVVKEPDAILKNDVETQDQTNMAFTGTMVTKGSATGIVVATGMKTVMGQIASLMSDTKKTITPLEYRLSQLGKILITVALLLTTLVVLLGIIQGHPVYQMFLAGVSLAVAAIPEGLPAIVTVALSLGVQRMIRKKAIVRDLRAVETLGCASVICSDKTGTLTENKMTVKALYTADQMISVTGDGYEATGEFLYSQKKNNQVDGIVNQMLLYGALCNNAKLQMKKGQYLVNGDPTDGALLIASRKKGISLPHTKDFKLIKELPFDSIRKRMSVIVEDEYGERFLITKGAPDIVIPRCSFYLSNEGKTFLKDTNHLEEAVNYLTSEALRTIAIGIRPLRDEEYYNELLEKELTFVGLFGMIDPPRKEVPQAIRDCHSAGVKTVMITGDHKETARAIAEEIGVFKKGDRIVTGQELNNMSDEKLICIIDDITVFARVSPSHKLKIVHALQKQGHIVAMTGDGVNDAPAIKASDIGISMGITGTDVTKEASSLILLDDNFATIRSAIEEGRNIYENIRKFIRYLLASNVGEILAMLFAILIQMPLPLVPVQILWVNLVTDGLPAIALGLDQPEDDLMKRPPRNSKEGIFSRGLGFKIITRGILIGIVTIATFALAYYSSGENLTYARTIAFSTLVTAQLIHVFDCRSEKTIFARSPLENIALVLAVVSSFLLLIGVVYWSPVQPIFHTVALGFMDWLLILGFSLVPTVFFAFSKK